MHSTDYFQGKETMFISFHFTVICYIMMIGSMKYFHVCVCNVRESQKFKGYEYPCKLSTDWLQTNCYKNQKMLFDFLQNNFLSGLLNNLTFSLKLTHSELWFHLNDNSGMYHTYIYINRVVFFANISCNKKKCKHTLLICDMAQYSTSSSIRCTLYILSFVAPDSCQLFSHSSITAKMCHICSTKLWAKTCTVPSDWKPAGKTVSQKQITE